MRAPMIIAPLLLALASRSVESGPMLPPGVNTSFQQAVVAVEEKLQASDFGGAKKAAASLPKSEFTIEWDDSKVPSGLRDEYAKQRDQALAVWKGITGAQTKFVNDHADIKFDFVDVLADPPGSGIPAGATYFWSTNPGDCRLETVIGLKRLSPPVEINPVNVYNEVAAGVGTYFGLVTEPFPGSFMGRTDQNAQYVDSALPSEMMLSRETLGVSHDLRLAIEKKKRLSPTTPHVFFDPKSIDMGTIVQGEFPKFSVQISNPGNSPLAIRFQPDCSCVHTDDNYQVIQPGGTYLLRGSYNTLLVTGEIHHTLLVNTNDADHPNFMVPVVVKVKPRYRFIAPDGAVVLLPEGGATFPVYLALADNSGIVPKDVQVAGVPGSVTFEPWNGELADPINNEGPVERHGYKLVVHLKGDLPVPGRDPVTLSMTTNNPEFQTIQANFYAQRGVVVLPPEVFMGDVDPGVRTYSVVVSGPAGKFHVKDVKSDWPHFKFTWYPNQDSTEYRIDATYDGKGQSGPILGTVTIDTDDADEPSINIPISGTIK